MNNMFVVTFCIPPQPMGRCRISCSRPCCLWWDTACAAKAIGGAPSSRPPWFVRAETLYLDAMCVRSGKESCIHLWWKWDFSMHSFSCLQGDSGGPLNCLGQDGRWFVHGVTSFVSSQTCNEVKKPTVFTRISAFRDWLSDVSSSVSSSTEHFTSKCYLFATDNAALLRSCWSKTQRRWLW